MLSYNTICWTQSSKLNCFGIGFPLRKVRSYRFQLWRPHYYVLGDEILTDIDPFFPRKTFLSETETFRFRQTMTILTQTLFRDKISFFSPKIFENIFFLRLEKS